MGEVLLFQERKVTAKGLRKSPLCEISLHEDKLRDFFFTSDYEKLNRLNPIQISLHSKKPILFYPGCGVDVLSPLLFMEKAFPELKQCIFVFADKEEMLGIIKTVLDEVGVSFKQNFFDRKKKKIFFYWRERLIELQFIKENVFTFISQLPEYHIYFEKAFRIFKGEDVAYERRVFEKLAPGGVLVSDSGFQWIPSSDLQRITVPKELSSYGEMVAGVKKIKEKLF